MGAPPLPFSVALRLDSAGFRVPTKKRKTTTTTTLKNEKYFPNGLASESTKGKRKEGREGRKEGRKELEETAARQRLLAFI